MLALGMPGPFEWLIIIGMVVVAIFVVRLLMGKR
jgi:hypothetical protein